MLNFDISKNVRMVYEKSQFQSYSKSKNYANIYQWTEIIIKSIIVYVIFSYSTNKYTNLFVRKKGKHPYLSIR